MSRRYFWEKEKKKFYFCFKGVFPLNLDCLFLALSISGGKKKKKSTVRLVEENVLGMTHI